MIGKYVCPQKQKQRERLEYYCMPEIYRGITLLSASTVDSIYNGFYIVFCRIELRCAAPLASEEDTEAAGAAPWVLPGDEPARVGELRRTSALCADAPYERIRPASKVKIYVRLSVCLYQIFAHQFNLVTFTCQYSGNKLYYGNCAVVSKDFCQLIELSYRIKIIFNEQRLSYINIRLKKKKKKKKRLTNVTFCSGVSSYNVGQ